MNRGIKNRGFTLIEMLVVVAVISILITLSTPLSNIYKSNRVATHVQNFVSTLNSARSFAVSGSTPVAICLSDGLTPPGCVANANIPAPGTTFEWAAGWIIFTDPTDTCTITAGSTVISEQAPLTNGFTLQVDGHKCIKYTAQGITPGTNGLWTLTDPSGNQSYIRGINITVAGRTQIDNCESNTSLTGCITP